jgi:hypothetical protein
VGINQNHGPNIQVWREHPIGQSNADPDSDCQPGSDGDTARNFVKIRASGTDSAGNPPTRPHGVKPATVGGTLRRLITDSDRQSAKLRRHIKRLLAEIEELENELSEESDRRADLQALLDGWTQNVKAITGEDPG